MADYAHTETDKRIEELEKRLQAEYRQAYRETKGKLEKYLSDFARKDEAKRKLVEKGELSQADYKKWRTNQMLTGQRWAKMVDVLAWDMNRTNQIAADIISGQLSPTFALNANFAAYGIENGFQTDFGFTLYNEDTVNRLIEENPDLLPAPRVDIPEDIRWNKQKITSNITQAVLQGKSIPEIAKTMQTVVGMNKASATRNARTAMTGAQNAGRQQAYDRAKAMGIKVKKEWVATLDGRTRHSHGKADGQQVELDGKFTVGCAKMRYPGDVQNGTPEEIYNCRCTMVTVEPPEILQGEQPRMTYQEWYERKENAENSLKSGGKNGIIESVNMSADNGFTLNSKKYTVNKNDVSKAKAITYAKDVLEVGNVNFDKLENGDVIQPMLEQLGKLKTKHNKHFYQIIVDDSMLDTDFATVSPDLALHLNAKYMNSQEATNDFVKRLKFMKLLPKGYENTDYIITHEFMHFVTRGEVDNPRSRIHKIIPNMETANKTAPCFNSTRNKNEFVADVMAMVEFENANYSIWEKIYNYFMR